MSIPNENDLSEPLIPKDSDDNRNEANAQIGPIIIPVNRTISGQSQSASSSSPDRCTDDDSDNNGDNRVSRNDNVNSKV